MAAVKDTMSGRPGHLDPGQEHLVKKFRQQVSLSIQSPWHDISQIFRPFIDRGKGHLQSRASRRSLQ